jgi:hypothetical protein
MADHAAVTVHVFVSDYAGAVESASGREEGVAVAVPDYAAISETVTVHVVASIKDYMTAREYDDGFNVPIPTTTIRSTFNAYTPLTTALSSTFLVGKPYQGNMRQAASARWNIMYPS